MQLISSQTLLPLHTFGYIRLVEAHVAPITALTYGEGRAKALLLLHVTELIFLLTIKQTIEVVYAISR